MRQSPRQTLLLLAAAVSWSVASASGRAAEWARDYERVFCSGLAAHFAGYFALGCHVGLELRARGVLATRGTGMEGTTLRLPAAAGEI